MSNIRGNAYLIAAGYGIAGLTLSTTTTTARTLNFVLSGGECVKFLRKRFTVHVPELNPATAVAA